VIKQTLVLTAATKCRSGFLIAFVTAITVVGRAAIRDVGVLNRNEAMVYLALGLIGFLSWLSGRLGEGGRAPRNQQQEAPMEEAAAKDPPTFFKGLKFLGAILFLSAATLSGVAAARRAPALSVQARAQPEVVGKTDVATVTNGASEVAFPALKLEGIICNGAKSSALINGQVLFIGEGLGSVVLVAVHPEYVTAGLQGQTKRLVLQE
jgi:hypothetical protein